MSKLNFFSFLVIFNAIILVNNVVSASEPLFYEDISLQDIVLIEDVLEAHQSSSFKIAHADLNEDGLDEHILSEKNCSLNNHFCEHIILSESQGKAVILGKVKARNIVLDNSFTNGVRDLLVYNNPKNDYDTSRYGWNALQSTYVLEGKSK